MKMMNNIRLLVVLVGVALVASPIATAQILNENFDSLAVGTNMQSVAGWEGWYGDESVAGHVTDEQAHSGNNSLRFTRPVDASPFWTSPTSGNWVLSTMQYVPSAASGGDAYYGVLHSYEEGTAGSAGWITEVISDFATGDVRISGGDTARVPLVRDAWVEIRTELNFDSSVATFYYNDELLGTRSATSLAGFDLWANSDDVMYFDDFWLGTAETYPAFVLFRDTRTNPADTETDVPRDVVLSWIPAEDADKYDVYLGTVFDDVNDADRSDPRGVLVSQGQSHATYEPDDLLDFGQTYYWRIDEVSAPPDLTIHKNLVLSFTAEPFAYPVENITATASSSAPGQGPENTLNDSGLDADDLHSAAGMDMWLTATGDPGPAWIQYEFDKVLRLYEMLVWNHNTQMEPGIGFGIKDAAVEYSVDGTNWATLGTTHEFARAPGALGYAPNTTVDLEGAAAKYVKLTPNSNWGGLLPQYGLSQVRFLQIPVHARKPSPDSDATDVDIDVTLGFRAGREAARHDVYLSTDEQAVIDGTAPVRTVTEAGYSPSPLELDTTYYWRIDEVNDAQTPTMWQGDIWNFTTSAFLVVDDFESYNEIPFGEEGSNLVYETWIDGFVNPSANGSTMGHTVAFEPSMEHGTVYDGRQSAPLYYDNTTASLSEVTANTGNLAIGRDWTLGSPQTLVLWVYGATDNAAQQMYVKVGNAKVLYGGDITDPSWNQWNIDLAGLGINLSNVTQLSIGLERIGATSGSGMVLVDAIRLY